MTAFTRGKSRLWRAAIVAALGLGVATTGATASAAAPHTFLGGLDTIKTVASTVPANGDVNPYGTALATRTVGRLVAGDVLVSNFNNSANLQGTGTTIVEISPRGRVRSFASIGEHSAAAKSCGGVGLTTALSVLKGGWVVVGSLPTTNGMAATATAGCLFVLNDKGRVVATIKGGPINGPWDMTAFTRGNHAELFVTNVLNGTVAKGGQVVTRGTVVRVDLSLRGRRAPRLRSETVIGRGFAERTDPAALVVGPTGVALTRSGTLYVADTATNRIAAISRAKSRLSAAKGRTVSSGGALMGPLGLTLAPNGDVLAVNAGNGQAVETTPAGVQVATKTLDSSGSPAGAGALFGLVVAPRGHSLLFVDDATNTLDRLS